MLIQISAAAVIVQQSCSSPTTPDHLGPADPLQQRCAWQQLHFISSFVHMVAGYEGMHFLSTACSE
jgi:hypothetical protein